MNRAIYRTPVFAVVLFASVRLSGQPPVHPFEQPPRLKEAAPQAASPLAAVLKTEAPQKCDPKGSITRSGSIVSVSLHLVRSDFKINNPDPTTAYENFEDPVTLRSYGGCKSGPVIDVFPGNTLRVDLHNELDANDPTCKPPVKGDVDESPAECFNTTNLHTHGLHVSPAGNGDNVLLNIAPQTSFPYEINIPSDHPAGTFWYHAHRHGSTAVNVASGAAGVLLIHGNRAYTAPTSANPRPIADIDTILHDARGKQFPEQVILFQQIPYACFSNDPKYGGPWQQIFTTKGLFNDTNDNSNPPGPPASAPWTCSKAATGGGKDVSRGAMENFPLQVFSGSIWDTNGRFTSLNGIVQPHLTVPAGQIQRWRLVHGGIHDTLNLQIVRMSKTAASNLIAASGLTGNRLQQQSQVASLCPSEAANMVPQFEIATDGLTRASMRTLSGKQEPGSTGSNYLQPGYRSDVLVVFPEDGDYCLIDQAAAAKEHFKGQGPDIPQLLAYVHVRGGRPVKGDLETYVKNALRAGNPKLPKSVLDGLSRGDLKPWAQFIELAPPPAGSQLQKADFQITNKGEFQVNGASYKPDVVNIQRQVNTTDDWVLTAEGAPHIFHIHVNPFEVMDVTDSKGESIYDAKGNCKPAMAEAMGLMNQYCGMYHTFRDTIFVENDFQVHIRTFYDKYIGEYVLHCHILDHEDAGMMLNIQIVPDLNAPNGGVGMTHNH